MRLEALKHLYDMQQACQLMASFLAGKTFEDYESDPLFRSGVERQLSWKKVTGIIVGNDQT